MNWKNRLLTGLCVWLLAIAPARAARKPYPLRDAKDFTVRGGLPNFFAKLRAGRSVRVAYLGGSITAQPGWRPKTLHWFQQKYPRAKVEQINAAIGGTGSDLGVFRLQHDVLQHQPDLLFVEFAVNDGGARPERIYRSMEGIVRQTWRTDPQIDICFVYTVAHNMIRDLQRGKLPRSASAMEVIADHYGIPSIEMGMEVARLEKAGKLVYRGRKPRTPEEKAKLKGKMVFSPDGVHPYPDTGHVLYLQAIQRAMAEIEKAGRPGPHALPAAYVKDNWERAKMLPLSRAQLSPGWRRLDPKKDRLARRFLSRMPELWKADKAGESVSFQFKGTYVAIYDLLGPDCGQVLVKLDNRKPRLARRIDGYCSYHRLAKLTIATNLPDTMHAVRVEISPVEPDKAKILQKRRLPDFKKHPEKYKGIAWYAGAILLIGDLAE